MVKLITCLFLISWSYELHAQEIPVPPNYTIVDTVSGDLDHDGNIELVVAYNTKKANDDTFESVPRALIIYKKRKEWTVWQKSELALLGSRDGGMMGDPFEGMEIKNGVLLIFESGGSSWKWNQIDKYRYQNGRFELIGFTSNYGKPCEYWENVDFNVSTGKVVVQKEYENCNSGNQTIYKKENEIFYKKGITLNLQNRRLKEIKIITPKYHREIYLANTLE